MKTLNDIRDLTDKNILVRIDTDVDVVHGKIVDDSRLRAALPTIRFLLDKGAAVTLMGHMGRPKGKVDEALSLHEVASHLTHLLIPHAHCHKVETEEKSPVLATQYHLGKDLILLENLRFDPGEEVNDPSFAKQLAEGHDYFVNESFATCHREAASTVGVAKLLPSYAGLRLMDEIAHLNLVKETPQRPLTLIVGGAKVEEKLGLLDYLLPKVDHVLTGGVVANIFLKAQGVDIKKSKEEVGFDELARELLNGDHRHKILVPTDYVWDRDMIVDIGPETVAAFVRAIKESETIFWAGTMGVVEEPRFAIGSKKLAEAMAHHRGMRMVGGGDTGTALKIFGLESKMSFISTGGGAALEYLAGKELPGVAALR